MVGLGNFLGRLSYKVSAGDVRAIALEFCAKIQKQDSVSFNPPARALMMGSAGVFPESHYWLKRNGAIHAFCEKVFYPFRNLNLCHALPEKVFKIVSSNF